MVWLSSLALPCRLFSRGLSVDVVPGLLDPYPVQSAGPHPFSRLVPLPHKPMQVKTPAPANKLAEVTVCTRFVKDQEKDGWPTVYSKH